VIVLAAVIADLCATAPESTAPPDPEDGAAYAQAGDEARRAGDVRIAAIAYRKAIAADRDNTRAKAALAALCEADTAPAFDAALLEAIAQFRGGDLEGAHAALVRLAAGAGAAASAQFFLGMIALRRNERTRAVRELELAARDPAYAESATAMLRLARRDGPLAAVVLAEPELDTNPQLVPDTPPAGATTGPPTTDLDLLVVGTITARPARWLALRDVLAWRNQRQLHQLDFLGETAQAAALLDGRADHLSIRYDLDYDVLDGTSYLFAHRGTAAYRHDLGVVTVGASYALRYRAYVQAAQAGFTGWVHAADLGATLHVTPQLDIDVNALGWRELTADPAFSDIAGGVQATVRARIGSRVRIAASGTVWNAVYDGAEPDGALRRDTHGEGTLDVEVDLDDHVIAVAGASLTGNQSTIEDFRYWKLVARAGIALAFGGP